MKRTDGQAENIMAERERASLAWLSVHCGVASVALCNIIPYVVYVAAMMVVWLAWPGRLVHMVVSCMSHTSECATGTWVDHIAVQRTSVCVCACVLDRPAHASCFMLTLWYLSY